MGLFEEETSPSRVLYSLARNILTLMTISSDCNPSVAYNTQASYKFIVFFAWSLCGVFPSSWSMPDQEP